MTFKSHRYSVEYAEYLQNVVARDLLVAVGLPARHVIFAASESSREGGVVRTAGRGLLRIGCGTEEDEEGAYCVDCGTGVVVYGDRQTLTKFHVSVSPRHFADCLAVFDRESRIPHPDRAMPTRNDLPNY